MLSRRKASLHILASLSALMLFFAPSCQSSSPVSEKNILASPEIDKNTRKPLRLKAAARLDEGAVPECSGIVMSRREKGTCWAIGDSGNGPWLYRFRVKVSDTDKLELSPVEKIRVSRFRNTDWEDIAIDDEDNLIIGDTGNNFSHRLSLSLLSIRESDIKNGFAAAESFSFYYREQKEKGHTGFLFDAEALFSYQGRTYLFTKRRRDQMTALYRFDVLRKDKRVSPTLLGYFDIGELVTAADVLSRERLVVLLTYKGLWLLQATRGDDFLGGKIWWLPVRAGQCEGVAFLDRNRILVCNERGEFFVVERRLFQYIKNSRAASP